MRLLLSALLMAGAAGFGITADDEKKETLKDKVTAFQKDFAKEIQQLNQELGKKFQEAKTDEEKTKIRDEFMAARAKGGDKVLDLVKEMPKDDFAFDATMSAMTMGSDKAADFLVANFVNDERLAKAIPQLAAAANGDKVLATLAEKSTDKNVKGIALFTMVSSEIEKTDYPRTGKPLPEKEATAKIAAAAVKLDGILKDFGDVKLPAGRSGASVSIADAGKKVKFFAENLVVGKKAPDAECELLEEGKKAKLSDYKGKVVVLDIWATWCGPCKAMIPHEREMVKHFEGKPFVFVSVSADDKKETLTKFLEKEEMPWTHWWNGRQGEVLEKFQVKFFPTIYIIDAKGVIRAKHLRGDALEKFCDKLVKEAEDKASE